MVFFDYIKDKKIMALILSIVINILLAVYCAFLFNKLSNYKCDNTKSLVMNESAELEEDSDEFYVEIKGAVKKPGVYLVNSNNIINDVVNLAGGPTKSAYTKNVNLSRKVSSELVIYIYTENEYKKLNSNKSTSIKEVIQEPCECKTYEIGNCTSNGASEIIKSEVDTIYSNDNGSTSSENENKDDSKNKVNINNCSKEELMSLSGIGESKANDIINYRNINGSFKSIEEIKNVSGIGDALFNKIKDDITI